MKASSVKGLENYTVQLKKELTEYWIAEQTRRFIEYAEKKIMELGATIQTYHSRHHMDRTGNLLNSLCWGVAYNHELKGSGFYRDASSIGLSHLHEFYPDFSEAFPVDGHSLAEDYIRLYGKASGEDMWRVWFAILAPYWGYWEKGFRMVSGGGRSGIPRSEKFVQFAVMSEFHDEISEDLKPSNVKIKIHVEKYTKPFEIAGVKLGSLYKAWSTRVDNPYGKYAGERRRK